VDRVLTGDGRAAPQQRRQAFGNEGLGPPLGALVGAVAARPARVTDADFAAATAAGCTEDQLFELVICAAVGEAARQYESALAALAEATGSGEAG
jgi:alkylhydroperoxidase family enzyme